jgi:hypothetical protein
MYSGRITFEWLAGNLSFEMIARLMNSMKSTCPKQYWTCWRENLKNNNWLLESQPINSQARRSCNLHIM